MTMNSDMPELEATVCELIARACNFQRTVISLNDSVYDIGLDSMGATALLAELEALYDVEFSSDKISEILQAPFVRDLVNIVQQVIGANARVASAAVAAAPT